MPKVVKMVKRQVEEEPETAPTKSTKVVKPAATAPVPEKTARAKAPSRYVGTTTGLRVMPFQDKTFKDNLKAKLSDEELAELWREEFPRAKKFDAKIVKVVRRLVNEGRHGGHQEWVPAKPVPEYVDGIAQPLPKPRASKKVEDVEEEDVETTPVKKGKK